MAIVDVVKYSGPARILAWKFPSEELSNWTQLIVNESQEAILFKGGQALDTYGPGRYTLSTNNIPLLTAFLKLPFGGNTPFTAEVWYVNKVHALDVKWGTPTPIQLKDPEYNIMVPLRANGQFGIQVDNSSKFLIKLVGTMPTFDQDTVVRYFRGMFITKIKDALASYLVQRKVSILEINAYLEELSSYMQEKAAPPFAEYGIKLLNFYVNDISVPEDDPAVKTLKNALAKKAEMNIVGYNYQTERTFDTLEGAARNPGSTAAGIMGAGIGLGIGAGVGGSIGQQFGGMTQAMGGAAQETVTCPNCNAQVPANIKFCPQCGKPIPSPGQTKVIKCYKCGGVIPVGSKFCPDCGNAYNPCPKCGADLAPGTKVCGTCGFSLPNPCPFCGEPLERSDLKFCPSCGKSLTNVCASCGHTNPAAAKFCLNCGLKL
ncbi:MAG: SPFH domain-containing protein [Deltaproteobacteria bacterium]|jgi:membrane protease subunit (stomatin/prohibitin family)|nr:SPFH domain-containing protein [Deltaproteobacteria bacterium]